MRLLPLLALFACAVPFEEPVYVPDLPTGGCGLPDYDWAPLATMGELVAWERLDAYSLDAAQIEAMLSLAGVEAFRPVLYGVRVYRIRYLTQDKGEIVEATGLISFPEVDVAQTVPTVLWTHPTMGFRDECAPTAQGLAGVAANLLVSSQGYAVAAPDYLGMAGWGEPSGRLHPWVVPEPTAIASLDALRALWRFTDTRLDPSVRAVPERRVIGWGASEGGFAALWADRYAAYLPEAELVATVAVVAPTDLLGMATHATNHFASATAGLVGVLTANHDWYEGAAPLSDALVPALADALPDALTCSDGGLFDAASGVEDVFSPDFLASAQVGAWDDLDPWRCYLEQATLRRSAVPRGGDGPVLFVIAGADDLVVAEVERADVPLLCDAGYTLDVLECADASHVDGAARSLPYQLEWVRDRFAGLPVHDATCVLPESIDCDALGIDE